MDRVAFDPVDRLDGNKSPLITDAQDAATGNEEEANLPRVLVNVKRFDVADLPATPVHDGRATDVLFSHGAEAAVREGRRYTLILPSVSTTSIVDSWSFSATSGAI